MAEHRCEYIYGVYSDPKEGTIVNRCDAPASIKRKGIWLCPEHYDQIEFSNGAIEMSRE